MSIAKVTSKGQIVLPAKIRSRYRINRGTRISIEERDDELVLKPLTEAYLNKIAGTLKTKGKLAKKLLGERKKEREKE